VDADSEVEVPFADESGSWHRCEKERQQLPAEIAQAAPDVGEVAVGHKPDDDDHAEEQGEDELAAQILESQGFVSFAEGGRTRPPEWSLIALEELTPFVGGPA
jgi:hypothetical protein